MTGVKNNTRPPAWFRRGNYLQRKLKSFTLLKWWEQFSVRAFVRDKAADPVTGALWLSDLAYREFRRNLELLKSGQIEASDLPKPFADKLLSLFSTIVNAVQFLLKCDAVDQLTFYHADLVEIIATGGVLADHFEGFLINELDREEAEVDSPQLSEPQIIEDADSPQLSEPQIIEDAPLHPLQEKIIELIEQNGIVGIDGLFDYGEWVYSFPCHWITRDISRIAELSPPIRPISATELNGLAEYYDSNPDCNVPMRTRGNRIFLSVPINLPDAFLKASFAACLETLRDTHRVGHSLECRDTTWADCGLLQCLDLHHWSSRNNDALSIQDVIDFAFARPEQDRTMYNKTTAKWMALVLQPDFLASLLEAAI